MKASLAAWVSFGVMSKRVKRKLKQHMLHIAAVVVLTVIIIASVSTVVAGGERYVMAGQEEAAVLMEVDFKNIPEDAMTLQGLESVERLPKPMREIVHDTLLRNVPAADYSYSFDGSLDDAVVVRRSGDTDDVGSFNPGTYPEADSTVMPIFVDGIEGEALYVDGTYGVELKDLGTLSDSYTISFWFKAEELCDWSPFIMIGSDLLNEGSTQNYISFNKKTTEEGESVVPIFNTVNSVWDNSCEIRPVMEDKQCINLYEWNYITICVDGSKISRDDPSKVTGYLYLNSELIGTGEISLLCLDEENIKAYVGTSCYDELFRASYDEIRIWNRLLDENQITDMYLAYLENVNY